jgi:ketosteroid isomerase-like protein
MTTRKDSSMGAAAAATAHPGVTDSELGALVERTAEAAAAFIRGDMSRYLALITHAPDYTLMAPFGGAPSYGFDSSSERIEELARYFTGGTSRLELVKSYASGDMVVLVVIERQRGEVGGLPEQDWSLRVTQVYRRDASDWRLVHRHADPLVKGIGLEKAASVARG